MLCPHVLKEFFEGSIAGLTGFQVGKIQNWIPKLSIYEPTCEPHIENSESWIRHMRVFVVVKQRWIALKKVPKGWSVLIPFEHASPYKAKK